MCFYVKRHLEYRQIRKAGYQLAREADIRKEEEKAKEEAEREREQEAARMKEVEDALLATV
jgi:ubiquitin carboxyl-terminal hydrolase 22/27/51